jgi:hypothetical protein
MPSKISGLGKTTLSITCRNEVDSRYNLKVSTSGSSGMATLL